MSMIREFVRLQADIMLAQQEKVVGVAARPMLKRAQIPAGEGRPVLLLPGFGANEALLKQLNNLLRQSGYESETFIPGFPKNQSLRAFIDELSVPLLSKVRELNRRTGKTVSLVGQSAGGLYSREFALRHPEGIDRVITLGSPTICPENMHLQNKALNAMVERRFGTSAESTFGDGRYVHWEKRNPRIPYVAIYSHIDGAVRAQTVVIPKSQLNRSANGAIRENIAVTSSHFGMVLNPFVMLAVADRLGSDPKNWQEFDPELYLPEVLHRLSTLAYPTASIDQEDIPVVGMHTGQPRGRDAQERVTRTLRIEHANISTVLNTLDDELGSSAGPVAKVPNYAVVAGILNYLHNYTDGFHHPREDLLFERLRKRQPELDTVICGLIAEHQSIDANGKKLEQALQRHLAGRRSAQHNKSVDGQCRSYVKKLRRHLGQEEKEVFPQVSHLHRHDWIAVDKGLPYEADPLFGGIIQQRYEELADVLAARTESVGVSVGVGELVGLEILASVVDTLGSGFTDLRKQRTKQKKTRKETLRKMVGGAMSERTPRALAALPLKLGRKNGAMTREHAKANFDAVKKVAKNVVKSVRQDRDTP